VSQLERGAAQAAKRTELRVTHVVFDLDGGGLETMVAALARRYAGTAVRMSVISLSGRPGRTGARVAPVLDQFLVTRPLRGLSMIAPWGLVRLIRQTRPDVVHVHSGCWYKGSLAARLAGVGRIVYTEHGRIRPPSPVSRWLDRRSARRTHVVVAVSDRLREHLQAAAGVDPRRIYTIYNGVDTEAFQPGRPPAKLRRALGLPADALVVGSVGRLEPVKAFHRIVEAVAAVGDASPRPVYVLLCGDGSERAALWETARRCGIGDRVRLAGWVDRPVDHYRLMNVFSLTSVSEGTSVSLLEAMATGVVPLVMDVGSNREVLGPDLRDLVVPAADVTTYVRVLRGVLQSPERWESARAAARARVVRHYSLDRMAEEYDALYRGLAASR
jgi:glycosyltransferase involved in cell wall biosynthesis